VRCRRWSLRDRDGLVAPPDSERAGDAKTAARRFEIAHGVGRDVGDNDVGSEAVGQSASANFFDENGRGRVGVTPGRASART
jgi:hypothetical protein